MLVFRSFVMEYRYALNCFKSVGRQYILRRRFSYYLRSTMLARVHDGSLTDMFSQSACKSIYLRVEEK